MKLHTIPARSVVYVMDAYCGWCWGFSNRVGEFEAANRHQVAFTVISGGLFVGERAGPIGIHPHIAHANERISRLTGAKFGDPYQQLLNEGNFVMDSTDAASGLAALRAQAPERAVHLAHRLQAAFYEDGLSLSDRATIAAIAISERLNVDKVLAQLEDGTAKAQAEQDFLTAHAFGISSYPTLLYVEGDHARLLPGTGTSLHVLNETLEALLAQPEAQH